MTDLPGAKSLRTAYQLLSAFADHTKCQHGRQEHPEVARTLDALHTELRSQIDAVERCYSATYPAAEKLAPAPEAKAMLAALFAKHRDAVKMCVALTTLTREHEELLAATRTGLASRG